MRSFAQILTSILARAAAIAVALVVLTPGAGAAGPASFSYWISMRGITEDEQPSYVAAAYGSGGSAMTAFTGCAAHTYYLTAADAAKVEAARTAGDTVQVHAGPQGSTDPAEASIVCLVQADQ